MPDQPNPLPRDLEPARIERELERLAAAVGRPLTVRARTGSTNDDAKLAAAAGAPHGATFLADAQSAGRGRGDHAWHSPPSENLYMSVVLRPAARARALAALPLAVGVAVATALERFAAPVEPAHAIGIKWPNDVVVGRRKLAGMLVEAQVRGGSATAVIAGIGINVHATSFPDELAARATSLALLAGVGPARWEVAARVLAALGEAFERFQEGGLSAFGDELRRRDALLGSPVRAAERSGTAAGIDEQGRLLVRDREGRMHAISSGGVELALPD